MFQEWPILTSVFVVIILYILIRRFLHRLRIRNITNRHVIISGCDSGFGNLLAKSLDSQGVQVIAGCLTKDGAAKLENETTSRLKTLSLDISDEESVTNALRAVKKLLPKDAGLWGLVNNAGIMPNYCPAEWTKLSEYKKVSDVNLFGSINMTLTFLPLIRRSNGRIINVCSAVCNVGMTGTTNYCVSKAGLRMFTTCLRRELLKTGVTVHSIEPGGFKTALTNIERLSSSFKQSYRNASEELKEVYGGYIADEVFRGIHNADPYICSRPHLVANAMEHALLGRFPKLRYLVGPDIYIFFGPLMYLPEWLVDYLICWPKPYGKKSKDLLGN